MTQAKIMKVAVTNIPKDLKVIELSSKKSYYFKEFDQKLQMIKELAEEQDKSFTLNIALVDYDDMTIDHYHLENYELTKYLNPSIKQIIESDALKQTDIEEKGITEQHMKAFINLLEESNDYDVASNEEVKTGKLKKAGLLSKLRFRSRKNKIESEEIISKEEVEKNSDKVADELAGNLDAENVYQTKEIAQVVDLPDSDESTQTDITSVNNSESKVNNSEAKHLDDSVVRSENQLNVDNTENPRVSEPVEIMKVTATTSHPEKADIKESVADEKNDISRLQNINLLQEGEKQLEQKFSLKQVTDLDKEKKSYKPENITAENPIEKKEIEFLQDREKEKVQSYNKALDLLSSELMEQAVQLNEEINVQIAEFMKANKPDYQTRINELLEQENDSNRQYLEKFSQTLDRVIREELEKDDKAYQLERNLKESKLNNEKEEKMDLKRNEISDGIERLKDRTRKDLDHQLKLLSEDYQRDLIKEKTHQLMNLKIQRMKEIDWSVVQFDRETFDTLREQKRVFEKEEIKREQLRLKEKELKHQEELIAIEKEEQRLENEQLKLEQARLETANKEADRTSAELEIEKAKVRSQELEIRKLEKDIELRKVMAKEDENKIIAEQNRLKKLEIESRNKETDSLNRLAQNKLYSTWMGSDDSDASAGEKDIQDAQESAQKAHNDTLNQGKSRVLKSKEFMTGLITAVLLSAGITAGVFGYQEYTAKDDVQAESLKKAQQAKERDYENLVKNNEYWKAYEVNESKADELKKEALLKKDYVDAVKLAKATDDKSYLMETYLKNGNTEDLTSEYNAMSYEEQGSLPNSIQKDIAQVFLKNKQYDDVRQVNQHLNDKELAEKITEQEKAEQENKEELKNTTEAMDSTPNNNQGDVNNEQTQQN